MLSFAKFSESSSVDCSHQLEVINAHIVIVQFKVGSLIVLELIIEKPKVVNLAEGKEVRTNMHDLVVLFT